MADEVTETSAPAEAPAPDAAPAEAPATPDTPEAEIAAEPEAPASFEDCVQELVAVIESHAKLGDADLQTALGKVKTFLV